MYLLSIVGHTTRFDYFGRLAYALLRRHYHSVDQRDGILVLVPGER